MSNVRYLLTWVGAPRPPVHPKPMQGKMDFESIEDAYAFFKKQPADATFVSLREIVTFERDCSRIFHLHMELDSALGI